MIEMIIDGIRVNRTKDERVIILKEKMAERYLPIWIGPTEADAIAVKLREVEVHRPLTHDLLASVINVLGAAVEAIVVDEIKADAFYARISLIVKGRQVEVDSRPSDALALAVRVGAPIFVEEVVLDKAGIILEKETSKPAIPEGEATETTGKNTQVSKEELNRMSAFTEFINTLDLGNFDKSKS